MQSLCGHLNFLNKCIIPGRAFTRRLYPIGEHLSKPHLHLKLTPENRLDMTMWLEFLNLPGVCYRDFFEFDTRCVYTQLDFYTDASRNNQLGAGGYCGDRYFVQQWDQDFIDCFDPSINFLELYALTVGVLLWIKDFKNRKIIIFCDNKSVISMVNKTTSSCKHCMVLIRMLVMHGLKYNVKLKVKYVKSQENTYADHLSRMRYDLFRKVAKQNGKYFRGRADSIPECLWPMEKIWLQ